MYPANYVLFLAHFHGDRDYFECHEVLEEYWKSLEGERKIVWVGLIQTAVGFYHYRRENRGGARRMFEKSKSIIEKEKASIEKLGLHAEHYLQLLETQIKKIESNLPYESVNLPIIDQSLLEECQKISESQGWKFGTKAFVSNQILHRHTLRNRSDVIEARKQALKEKKRL